MIDDFDKLFQQLCNMLLQTRRGPKAIEWTGTEMKEESNPNSIIFVTLWRMVSIHTFLALEKKRPTGFLKKRRRAPAKSRDFNPICGLALSILANVLCLDFTSSLQPSNLSALSIGSGAGDSLIIPIGQVLAD